jgi:hypothetical protein
MILKLRNMRFATAIVHDLSHVALVPEVQHTLIQWIKAKVGPVAPGILIGGLAMSFYAKPRTTQDIDLLFLSEALIPLKMTGFRRNRKGAFENRDTNVVVEVITPESINLPSAVAQKVYQTARNHSNLKVASLEAMIVLKLFGADSKKRELQDLGDIVRMLESNPEVYLQDWPLSNVHRDRYEDAKERANS